MEPTAISSKRPKERPDNDDKSPHLLRAISVPESDQNEEEREVNHEELAKEYPELLSYLVDPRGSGKKTIDFRNDEATRLYNQALLNHWFDIKIDLPQNHLCPTTLSRANYIRWIAKLLKYCEVKEIVGIDVGTGASCIYPLLGHAIYGWKFVATDVDPESLQWAVKNVNLNNWNDSISVVHALPSSSANDTKASWSILLGALNADTNRKENKTSPSFSEASFSMCNPPFFENANDKVYRQDTACVATDGELATTGGEVEFVKQMIFESISLGTRISWYTSLLGKKSSLYPILEYLRSIKPLAIETTTFRQGRNSRWAIAWTFDPVIKSRLIVDRLKMVKYSDKTFVFDTEYTSVAVASLAMLEIPIGVKIRKIDDSKLNVVLYESSPWIISTFGDASSSKTDLQKGNAFGPDTRPTTICTIKMTLFQLPHHSNLSVLCECVPGTVIEGLDDLTPEHAFGVFVRELMALLVAK